MVSLPCEGFLTLFVVKRLARAGNVTWGPVPLRHAWRRSPETTGRRNPGRCKELSTAGCLSCPRSAGCITDTSGPRRARFSLESRYHLLGAARAIRRHDLNGGCEAVLPVRD